MLLLSGLFLGGHHLFRWLWPFFVFVFCFSFYVPSFIPSGVELSLMSIKGIREWSIDILIFIYNEGGQTTTMYTLRSADNTFIFFRGQRTLVYTIGGGTDNLSIYFRGGRTPLIYTLEGDGQP